MRRASFFGLGCLALVGLAPRTSFAVPLFVDATSKLGSPQPCYDPMNPDDEGCYTHYVLMADLDHDGDLDLVFAGGGGYYAPTQQPDPGHHAGGDGLTPLLVYLNDGQGNFTYVNDTIFGGWKGRVRQIAIGDVDGDGDLDIYVPQGYGQQADGIADAFFINDGMNPPHFTDESATRLPITSRAGAVRFGDVDGDGDLDLVVTDWGPTPPASPGTAHVYLNDGHGFFTEKMGAVPMDTNMIGTGPIDIDFADVDGDFDLDLVVASRSGDSLLFVNDGTGTFTNATFPKQPGPYVYGPDECDVDGDGDLDVWLDNGGMGHTEQLLINDGHGNFTDETAARVVGNPSADDNKVQCVDVDGDGDFDAVIASLSNEERVLINDGTGHFTLEANTFPAMGDSTLGLDVGDVDGDGLLDVITAQGESGPFLNHLYLGIAPQTPDVRPPAFRAVEKLADGTPPGPAAVRFAVSDSATTDTGPRVKSAWLEVNGDKNPATFVGGDLFRAAVTLPSGDVSYRACAIDLFGNQGCSAMVTLAPAMTDASSATSTVTSSSSSAPSSSTSSGSGGAAPSPSPSSDSGCGCSTPGGDRPLGLAWLGAGLVLVALRRSDRRRRGRAASVARTRRDPNA